MLSNIELPDVQIVYLVVCSNKKDGKKASCGILNR
jgi:hypothetical protein